MAEQLVTIATFDLPPKARLAQNVLEEAGIKAVVADETVVGMDWLLGNAVGWVKLQVMEADADRAVAVLEESLGTGDEPADPEVLAAEAEAAGAEEGAEPPESEPETLKPTDPTTAPVPPVATEPPPADEAEPKPSERDQYARRFFLTAIFSLVALPLWFYALYLFLNTAFGEGPISDRGRLHLRRGGIVFAIGFFIITAFFMFI